MKFADLLQLSTMTVASSDPDGSPHAAPVYFAADEALRLYFFSAPDSLHSRHLAENPRAAGAIYPECHDWRDIRGLQLHGQVGLVPHGQEWDAAWKLYAGKFPFVSELRDVVEQNHLYVFIPSWIRLVDNRRGFGFKQEWNLP